MSVIGIPSRFHVLSVPAAPFAWKFDCWPDSAPPTLTRSTMTPGTVWRTTHGSRDDGMFCSSSMLTLVEDVIFFVSTTGVSLVTCTCVDTPATAMEILRGTLAPVPTDMLLFK